MDRVKSSMFINDKVLSYVASIMPVGKTTLLKIGEKVRGDGFIRCVDGPLMQANWSDLTFRFCVKGAYGSFYINYLRSITHPFVFIDIGANQGFYTLVAFGNKRCVRFVSFEPNPRIFPLLVANVRKNAVPAECFEIAISDQDGLRTFAAQSDHSGTGSLSLGESRQNIAGSLQVECRDHVFLDKIFIDIDVPKVVKVDVEGHEPTVVSQLIKSRFWPSVCSLYVEVNEARKGVRWIDDLLKNQGLLLQHKNGTGYQYDLLYVRAAR